MIEYSRLIPGWDQTFPVFPGSWLQWRRWGSTVYEFFGDRIFLEKEIDPNLNWSFDAQFILPPNSELSTSLIVNTNLFMIRSPRTRNVVVAVSLITNFEYSLHRIEKNNFFQYPGYKVTIT